MSSPRLILSLFFILAMSSQVLSKRSSILELLKTPVYSYVAGENLIRSYIIWPYGQSASTKDITIGLETYNFDGGLRQNSTCVLRLSTGSDNVTIDNQYLFVVLGKNRAVVLWKEGQYNETEYEEGRKPLPQLRHEYTEAVVKMRVVNMDHCHHHSAKFEIDEPVKRRGNILRDVNIVPCEDGSTFEVFFRNRRLCQERRCRAMYDSNANLVAQPDAYLDLDFDLATEEIYKMNSSGPYVILASDDYKARSYLLLINSRGERLVNHTFSQQSSIRIDEFKKLASSHAHGYLGFCEQSYNVKQLTCKQFDAAGNLKLNFTIEDLAEKMGLLRVMNLPEAGFALVVGKTTFKGYDHVKLWKVEPNGETAEVSAKEKYSCSNSEGKMVGMELFETSEGSICLSYACFGRRYNKYDKGQQGVLVKNECLLS